MDGRVGEVRRGWVARDLAAELPGVDVYWLTVAARPAKTPRALRERMRELAGRITGAGAIHSRQDSVPWSYRVLWRRLGVDPDSDRPPFERLLAERLERGGLPSRGMPADATVVATLETGVPVLVSDAASLHGDPGLRPATAEETLGGSAGALRAGEIVYADRGGPLAALAGTVADAHAVGKATTRMAVCALAAPAVAQIEVEEALWTAAGMLVAADADAGRLDAGDPGRTQ